MEPWEALFVKSERSTDLFAKVVHITIILHCGLVMVHTISIHCTQKFQQIDSQAWTYHDSRFISQCSSYFSLLYFAQTKQVYTFFYKYFKSFFIKLNRISKQIKSLTLKNLIIFTTYYYSFNTCSN